MLETTGYIVVPSKSLHADSRTRDGIARQARAEGLKVVVSTHATMSVDVLTVIHHGNQEDVTRACTNEMLRKDFYFGIVHGEGAIKKLLSLTHIEGDSVYVPKSKEEVNSFISIREVRSQVSNLLSTSVLMHSAQTPE